VSSKLPSSDSEANSTNQNQGGRLSFSRYALFFLPCLIGVVVDLATKSYMFRNHFDPNPGEQEKVWWDEGIFGIQTSTNPGALFGMGSGYSWFFAGFSIIALVGILVWLFRFGGAYDRWLTFALGLVSGGILGNFYDRVGWGYTPGFPVEIKNNVRDWILFELDGVRFFDPWPNFNIADVCLVCGAVMLFIHAFLYAEPDSQNEETEESDASSPETVPQ
jgi:signal peptidase II